VRSTADGASKVSHASVPGKRAASTAGFGIGAITVCASAMQRRAAPSGDRRAGAPGRTPARALGDNPRMADSPPPATLSGSWTIACLCAAWCRTCDEVRPHCEARAAALPAIAHRWIDVEDEADALGDLDCRASGAQVDLLAQFALHIDCNGKRTAVREAAA